MEKQSLKGDDKTMNEMSQRFLQAFNTIENQLQLISNSNQHLRFFELIDIASQKNSAVRRSDRVLRKFGNLRNLLAHEKRDLAIPSNQAVEKIEAIAKTLASPPQLFSLFAMKVETCSPADSVLNAARTMHNNKFSQLPVVDDGGVVELLTSETIARWLAARLEKVGLLESESVEVVLEHKECDSTFKLAVRTATVFDALDLFDQALHAGEDLDAILITHGGHKNESILGILTPFDIPRLLREAQLKSD